MHIDHLQSLPIRKQPRQREGKLKAVERIARLRVGPQISTEDLEREIDRARAQETERGLAMT